VRKAQRKKKSLAAIYVVAPESKVEEERLEKKEPQEAPPDWEYQREADEVFAIIAGLTPEGGDEALTKEELVMAHHGDAEVYAALDADQDSEVTKATGSPRNLTLTLFGSFSSNTTAASPLG